jgi:hypothetical protein
MGNKITDILLADLDLTGLKLSSYNSEELLDVFKSDFLTINDYVPANEFDKSQILEYSKCFVEEFKRRIDMDSIGQLVEFAKLLQKLMKEDKTMPDSFFTRTLVRLYSYAINKMKDKKIPDIILKRDFL